MQKKIIINFSNISKLNLIHKVKVTDDNLLNHETKLVKDFYIKEDVNYSFKDKMEDFYKVYEKSNNQMLFCLFDGHGGDYVAKFAQERFPEMFFTLLFKFDNNAYKAFQESLMKIDTELHSSKAQYTGATSTIIYITLEDGKKYLFSANLGDSRSLLISKDKFLRLSYDHKCNDKDEIERMKSVGGFIINGRLLGTINLSRAIGDLALKKSGLSNIPFITKIELTNDDLFVVIASDGVWDVITDLDAYNISKSCSNSMQLSEYLVKESMSLGSRDNISCIAINL